MSKFPGLPDFVEIGFHGQHDQRSHGKDVKGAGKKKVPKKKAGFREYLDKTYQDRKDYIESLKGPKPIGADDLIGKKKKKKGIAHKGPGGKWRSKRGTKAQREERSKRLQEEQNPTKFKSGGKVTSGTELEAARKKKKKKPAFRKELDKVYQGRKKHIESLRGPKSIGADDLTGKKKPEERTREETLAHREKVAAAHKSATGRTMDLEKSTKKLRKADEEKKTKKKRPMSKGEKQRASKALGATEIKYHTGPTKSTAQRERDAKRADSEKKLKAAKKKKKKK